MIPFLALVKKDLRLFFQDRRAVIVGLVVPIVCGSFFGYLFGGQRGKSEPSKMAVLFVDDDHSAISRGLSDKLAADKNLNVKPATLDEARAAVRKGKATAAVVVPRNFGTEAGNAFFGAEKKPEIGLLYDPSHGMELGMISGILNGAVMQVVSKEIFSGESGRATVKQQLARVESSENISPQNKKILRDLLTNVDQLNQQQTNDPNSGGATRGLSMPYETREEAITAGRGIEYNGYAHSFGGMGIQFILFMGLDVGIRLLLLRQSGLWQRLRAAPLSKTMLLGSRATSAAIIAGFILLVLFAFARVVFGVHIQGSFLGFVGVCAAFSLMTAAFGLMVAALGKTIEATRGYAVMGTLLMVMLGGAWVPTFIFPQWLQKFTIVIPTRWAMDGIDAMTWRGLGLSAAVAPMAVMLLFTLAFGLVAVNRFSWQAAK
jgi:ABC-2 type transport system permease protein